MERSRGPGFEVLGSIRCVERSKGREKRGEGEEEGEEEGGRSRRRGRGRWGREEGEEEGAEVSINIVEIPFSQDGLGGRQGEEGKAKRKGGKEGKRKTREIKREADR